MSWRREPSPQYIPLSECVKHSLVADGDAGAAHLVKLGEQGRGIGQGPGTALDEVDARHNLLGVAARMM
jgi:hypothetical protein